ncbi:MAG: GTP pyrophosphokinase family protein [Firmicutes bacterium]|nr:GTP pyrophosphokinase family protein [Bacillota bacterium]
MYKALMTEEMKPWRDLLMIHEFAVTEILTKLNILDEEFRVLHDYNPIEHIRHRIKKHNNIIEKLERLGLEPTVDNAKNNIFDIAGIRIICAFQADIYQVVNMLSQHTDVEVIEIKDYIENPKPNGYQSLHMHVLIPVYLSSGTVKTRVEIQIRTVAMDFWASIEHKIYYKYREKAPKFIQNELKECADMISMLDERMFSLKMKIIELDTQCVGEECSNKFPRESEHY